MLVTVTWLLFLSVDFWRFSIRKSIGRKSHRRVSMYDAESGTAAVTCIYVNIRHQISRDIRQKIKIYCKLKYRSCWRVVANASSVEWWSTGPEFHDRHIRWSGIWTPILNGITMYIGRDTAPNARLCWALPAPFPRHLRVEKYVNKLKCVVSWNSGNHQSFRDIRQNQNRL